MKRSEMIILGAAGLIIVAAFWPKSEKLGEGGEPLIFANPLDCKTSGSVSAETCETEFGKAAERQLAEAPKFTDANACEQAHGFGACRPATWNGASVFVPAMVGFMLARSWGGLGAPAGQPLYGAPPQPCPPGVDTAARPECGSSRSNSSSSGSSGSSSRSSGSSSSNSSRSYKTGSGQVVVPFSGSGSRVSTSPSSSGSSTTARGGFGSTSHSVSSGG